jgi:hypothetical protein
MRISIQRNGQVFGPYPAAVVEKWIASGQVQRHDLGCRDLVEGWQPLGKLLWPERFAAAGSFSRKQWTWIVAALVGFVSLIAVTNSFDSNRSSTSNVAPNVPNSANTKVLTDFERGEQYFKEGSYFAANDAFQKVRSTDPHYADAQAKLKITQHKVSEYEQLQAKKDALRKQYQKLCDSGLYLFQIEERLQGDRFHMDDSRFEEAPDGSKGVRQYFSKTTSDGSVIKIWLQSGYSMSAYYCNVEVQ